jgi:hypothetical protein
LPFLADHFDGAARLVALVVGSFAAAVAVVLWARKRYTAALVSAAMVVMEVRWIASGLGVQ